MKRVLLSCFLLGIFTILLQTEVKGQTTVFFEDFETTPVNMTSASTGTPQPWGRSSVYSAGGIYSDTNFVQANADVYLMSDTFTTTGLNYVTLDFDHICKIDVFDNGVLSVSTDSGATWTKITSVVNGGNSIYYGSGGFSAQSDEFKETTYGTWQPGSAVDPANSWWKHEKFDISTLAGNQNDVIIRFALEDTDGNGANSRYGWLLDNIEVVASPCETIDPDITYPPTYPVGSEYNTGPYEIKAHYYDQSGLDTAMLIYTVNGGQADSSQMWFTPGDTIRDTIPAASIGDTICYYIYAVDSTNCQNSTIEPSSPYCFEVKTAPPSYCNGIPVSNYPYSENFESFTTGTPGVFQNGWENETSPTDDEDWFAHSGTTTSFGGPSGDHTTGSGVYLYTEVSPTSSGDEFHLLSPCFDFENLNAPLLEFWYHMNGSNMGSLHLDVLDSSGTWNLDVMTPLSGDHGNQWLEASVGLSAFSGQIVRLRFRAIGLGCCAGDRAIDDINITEPQSTDAEMLSLISPDVNMTPCGLSNNEPVTIKARNFGYQNIDTLPIAYNVNGGPVVRDTIIGTLTAFQDTIYTFSTGANLSTPGTYTIKTWTELPGDMEALNDTVWGTFNYPAPIVAPFLEDFESFSPGNGSSYPSHMGSISNGWSRDPDASGSGSQWAWGVNQGTTSSFEGPGIDHTLGNSNGIYMYPEASSGSSGDTAFLTTPCINIDTSKVTVFSYWYHRNGDDMGDMYVDLLSGGTWSPIDTLTGRTHNSETEPYLQAKIDLRNYLTSPFAIFRFRAISQGCCSGDMAIDDVNIYERDTVDVGVITVNENAGNDRSFPQQNAQEIEIIIKNFGLDTINNLKVGYSVNGGAPTFEYWNGTLIPNDTTRYTFSAKANLPVKWSEVCAFTDTIKDSTRVNDTTCVNMFGLGTEVLNYADSFDLDTLWYPYNDINASGSDNWEIGSPSSNPNGPLSAPNCWDMNLNTFIDDNAIAYLKTPFFDFTSAEGAELYFDLFYDTDQGDDGVRLEYTTDSGLTWTVLGNANMTLPQAGNWYDDNSLSSSGLPGWTGLGTGSTGNVWKPASFILDTLDGKKSVQFRFVYTSNGFTSSNGFAIDNFEIIQPALLDAKMDTLSIIGPGSNKYFILPGTYDIRSRSTNLGVHDLDSVELHLEIDNGATVNTSVNKNLAPGIPKYGFFTHTFPNVWNATPGSHILELYTSKPNGMSDQEPINDTFRLEVMVIDSNKITANSPYCNDFEAGSGLNPWVTLSNYNYKRLSNWELGTPDQDSLNSANSGTNSWMTKLDTNYQYYDSSALYTPLFDIDTSICYKMSFSHNFMTEKDFDGGVIEYSIDSGKTWNQFGGYNDTVNWYNTAFTSALQNNPESWASWSGRSPGWMQSSNILKFNEVNEIIFKFRFASDGYVNDEGWAIDDFCFEEYGDCDVEPEDTSTTDSVTVVQLNSGRFTLGQNYPNPALGQTTIDYHIPNAGDVQFKVIDMLGREVYFEQGTKGEGDHRVNLSTSDMKDGVYYYSVNYEGFRIVKKMVIANTRSR